MHEFPCARGCESWGEDGCYEGIFWVDFGDVGYGCSGVREGCCGRFIAVVVWSERIHAATTDEGSLADRETEITEEIG